MNEEELYPDKSRSLEDLRHMRLIALLKDMIDDLGKVRAARALGVNYRTLVRAEESEQMTARMSAELERHLLLGGGSAAAQQRENLRALEDRVGKLDERLGSGLEDIGSAVEEMIDGLRDEQAETIRRLERRLSQVEFARDAGDGTKTVEEVEAKPDVKPAWRPYRDVVTPEPEPGEEQVYGDAAPLIVEWREARAEFLDLLKTGPALRLAVAQERTLELEIKLIDQHELTLPPRTYPWDWSERRDEVWRRTQTLERVHRERVLAQIRQWIRRKLTFGQWRN